MNETKSVLIPDHLQPVDGVEAFADVGGSGEGRNRRLFPLDCCVQLVFNVLAVFHGAGFRDFTVPHSHVWRVFWKWQINCVLITFCSSEFSHQICFFLEKNLVFGKFASLGSIWLQRIAHGCNPIK